MSEKYFFDRTIKTGNCTVRVWRPHLTEEETERRMKQIRTAAESLLKSVQK